MHTLGRPPGNLDEGDASRQMSTGEFFGENLASEHAD
jgi:hypothetical protein